MAKKVYPHELIGETIEVIDSTNKSHLRIKGKVVDETKSTLVLEVQGEMKTLLKNNITFKTESGQVIEGKSITKRPEDRIKG